ncbi:murein biosynthesis integral membrane protein MurJ [Streptomyces sp. NPDC002537]
MSPRPRLKGMALDRPQQENLHTCTRAGTVMALGTLVCRITGFVRNSMVVAALGTSLLGDTYAVANVLPNTLLMLLLGGALNGVLVPELIRARHAPDGGAGYRDRLLTLGTIALAITTTGAVLAAPALTHTVATAFTGRQLDLAVSLAQYCLPQLFFYGLFALLSQILIAHDRFTSTAWVPALNNLIAIAVFATFIILTRTTTPQELTGGQAALLGLGSTLGIAVQALALWPALRRTGYTWTPRFDWRGHGLARLARAAGWACTAVATSQVAFWAITRMATRLSQRAARQQLDTGMGLSTYLNAYQVWIVPHGVIAVSLTTAALPALTRTALHHNAAAFRQRLTHLSRALTGLLVPITLILGTTAPHLATLAYGYGRTTAADCLVIAQTLTAFAPGLPALSLQYAYARALQTLGDARTPALLTTGISALNVTGSALACTLLPTRWAVIGMASAHTCACLAGAVATAALLARRTHTTAHDTDDAPHPVLPLQTTPPGRGPVNAHLRITAACLPGAAAATLLTYACPAPRTMSHLQAAVQALTGGALVLISLLLFARPTGAAQHLGILTELTRTTLRHTRAQTRRARIRLHALRGARRHPGRRP